MMTTQYRKTRRAVMSIGLAVCAGALFAAPAHADDAAEGFVREILVDANRLFVNEDDAAQSAGIEMLVEKYVDMRRVGLFTLGQYARIITDEQKAQYLPLFEQYATLIYRDALSNYSGQTLEVTNSIDRSERDIIVNSRIVDAKPGDPYADLTVTWRIYRGADGKMSIFDAGADGVWLAIEQQSQFKSVIANNGGGERGIDALIANLRQRVAP